MVKNVWWIVSLMWAVLIFRLTTYPQLVVTQDSFLQMIIMTAAHFLFFGIQAAFLFLALRSSYTPIIVASAYGLIIELIQRSVPGRSADPIDWVLDTLGAFAFVVLMRKYKGRKI